MTPRLKNKYIKEILPNLMTKLNYKNKHEAPSIEKIVLNIGLGEDATDSKKIKSCQDDMSSIAGQKAIVTKFRKSIANFKTRLINIALPRIKDFRGLSPNGIDKFGNYSFGIKEHLIFPEINFDKVDKIRGMDITIVTSSKSKEATIELLKEFNFPLTKILNKN